MRDHGRYVCERLRKATKVGSTATVSRNSVLIISHITFRDCREDTVEPLNNGHLEDERKWSLWRGGRYGEVGV